MSRAQEIEQTPTPDRAESMSDEDVLRLIDGEEPGPSE